MERLRRATCTDGTSNTIAFAGGGVRPRDRGALSNRKHRATPTAATWSKTLPTTPAAAARGRRPVGLLRGLGPVSLRLGQLGAVITAALQACAGLDQPVHRFVFGDAATLAGVTATAAGPIPTSSRHPTATRSFPAAAAGGTAPAAASTARSATLFEQPSGRGEYPDDRRQRRLSRTASLRLTWWAWVPVTARLSAPIVIDVSSPAGNAPR